MADVLLSSGQIKPQHHQHVVFISLCARLSDTSLILDCILSLLEDDPLHEYLVAVLCVLEVTVSGLSDDELRHIVCDTTPCLPPPPYNEKDEEELLEKEISIISSQSLSEEQWDVVISKISPYVARYSTKDNTARYFLSSRVVKNAVLKRYFKAFDVDDEPSKDIYRFWHKKLADFFETTNDLNRRAEEYLHHIVSLHDEHRVVDCLQDLALLGKFFADGSYATLLSYWKECGGRHSMPSVYKNALSQLEEREPNEKQEIAKKYEQVSRLCLVAGKYTEAFEFVKVALKYEEKELGSRPERMVELYSLLTEIYDERLKLQDFISTSQIPDLRKTINYGQKAISLRKDLPGNLHKYKLGLSLTKLAFSLESWSTCGGDNHLLPGAAVKEGYQHVDLAVKIFQELNDMGHYAEALMTKGVLSKRGSEEQLKYYTEAMELCGQVYGEYSLLGSRLFINIGILHEDNKDYVTAYHYFKKWSKVSEVVLGFDHPKTARAQGVLGEPRYRLIAERLRDVEQNLAPVDYDSVVFYRQKMRINEEAMHMDHIDDDRSQTDEDSEGVEIEEPDAGDDREDQNVYQGSLREIAHELQRTINDLLRHTLSDLALDRLQDDNESTESQNSLENVEDNRDAEELDNASRCEQQ